MLDVGADVHMSDVIDLLGAARLADFDAVEIARGVEIASTETRTAGSGELLLVLQKDRWSLDWWTPAGLKTSVQSGYTTNIGTDVEGVVSKWTDAPCHLAVTATPETSFLAVAEGAMAVIHGHRCVQRFSLGLFASPPYVNSTRWDPGSAEHHRKVLTVRVPVPPAVHQAPVVREQVDVRVGPVVEHWRIQWRDPPLPLCMESWGCICAAFGHPQHGQADLIRSRAGKPDEIFSLSSIYDEGLDTPPRGLTEAILPAWPVEPHDFESNDVESVSAAIQERKLVTLMSVHDYDHDGQASEFILPIGGVGCVFHHYVAIGLSKQNPKLHVLGTAEHPDAPLRLSYSGWETLKRGSGKYVESPCGNHGSEEQIEIALRTARDGIHGTTLTYACPRELGRLVTRKEW